MVNKLIFLSPLTALIFSYFYLYYYFLFYKILKNISFYIQQIHKFSSLLLYRIYKKSSCWKGFSFGKEYLSERTCHNQHISNVAYKFRILFKKLSIHNRVEKILVTITNLKYFVPYHVPFLFVLVHSFRLSA